MNIIEAIKSGKRFRRKSWKANEMNWISQDRGDLPLQLTRGDIVAEDWELKQEPVTITREQLLDAYLAAGKSDDVKHGRIDLINAIVKELGL